MLNRIGFFHFENLVKNRIPFLFLNMTSEDISSWYTSIYKNHLEMYQKQITLNTAESEYLNSKLSKDTAFVLLCHDGVSSLSLAEKFQQAGYTNVYVIDGGYQQLVTERSSS